MLRYFFAIIDDDHHTFADQEGQFCSSPAEAEAVAVRLADEFAQDPQYQGFLVCATDHAGNEVARVRVPTRPQGQD